MIRNATPADVPAMLNLLGELYAGHPRAVDYDRAHTAGSLRQAMASDWLVIVADDKGLCGLLVASAGSTLISPKLVAMERFWIARGGWGWRLKARYEAWARERGCVAATLGSYPGDRLDRLLARDGYVASEAAWVKGL